MSTASVGGGVDVLSPMETRLPIVEYCLDLSESHGFVLKERTDTIICSPFRSSARHELIEKLEKVEEAALIKKRLLSRSLLFMSSKPD